MLEMKHLERLEKLIKETVPKERLEYIEKRSKEHNSSLQEFLNNRENTDISPDEAETMVNLWLGDDGSLSFEEGAGW
jgi:hypothetical protein